ncbi:hypothetical protein [Croceicoccus sp. YJ47]|uniref:hypothetical protein n=1 Tax=Croceicoccus sp. YJ47 TaxID=2798724 RepID=UPI0019205B81|nr:hypothetical protein [Croceicoccus sp. YJ47]QQN74646.1 hypothetical protein JD971_02515 [Croceicoccus sp. YJ47]
MIGRGRDGIARLALCAALAAGAPGVAAQDAPDLAVTQPDEMGELGEGSVVADPWDREPAAELSPACAGRA